MLKRALPVLCCLLVMSGHCAFAGEPCLYQLSLSPDTLPTDLRNRVLLSQPVVKQAVILAVNQRAGPDSIHTGVAGTGSVNTGVAGSGSMNIGVPGTGSVNTGVAGSGSMNIDVPGNGSVNTGVASSGNQNNGVPFPDSIPFNKLGLSGMNTSAKNAFTQYLESGKSTAGMARMKTMFNEMKDSTKTASYIDNKLRGFYALRNNTPLSGNFSLPGKPQNQLKGISWTTAYTDTTAMLSGWWNEGVVQDVVKLGGIPIQINYSTLSGYNYAGPSLNNAHFVQFSFDREAYLNDVNTQLTKNYDLKKYFLEDIDIKSSMQSYVSSSLNTIEQEGVKNKVSGDQLMYYDTAQLRQAIMGQLRPISLSADSAKQLAASKDSNDQVLYKRYQQSEYYRKALALKSQIGDVKEMNQLLGNQKQVSGNIENWMQQDQNISNTGGKLLQMSFLQKMMMNMQSLKAGSVGDSNNLFISGLAGSFLQNNKALSLLAGNSSELGIQDVGMQSATGKTSYSMQGISIGKGATSFSVLNASSKAQTNNGFNTSAISRNVFVGAVGEKVSLGSLGTLDVTLSKSSSTYGNAADAASVSKSAAGALLDDLWATAAIGLTLNGSVKEWGMTHKVYVNYSGLGYVNPGAPFASRGTMQYGVYVKRAWKKNKATVSVRTDIRDLATAATTSAKRTSMTYAVDGRYRFTKKVTVGVNLLQSSLREDKTTAYMNRKITFTSQVNGKIDGHVFSNSSTLGIQQLNYLPLKTLFLNVGSAQTVVAGPGMVIVNLNYSRDINNAAVYNNILNTEGGYQYTLGKKTSCSSSLIYMNSVNVVEQIGIRQQVATQLYKRWNASLSADVRQNLFNSSANYYYGKFNTAMAVQYLIN